mmetsp:Transcript_10833/g.14344  ORF Transcript_10833/g.14344 Transcript_10833/m.14344 type:complete len:780 (+) Transcript_10833:171-2510(+)|eukprot:CAMPEP_0198144258 /NCGR_PEP_ID=MMETSP1443-20131203/14332_1 /TAXON_ID=186043 /ORGANISM="Entomoneis sp., Strain CCMP2396" /LENGTH=779 /DNA_ID=CAMNT_0043807619 /DNA_START=87 /DNA_END=2426 /DNA_ORIENTATION=-
MASRAEAFIWQGLRYLSGGGGDEEDDGHSIFGVHIEYVDLYDAFLFLVIIYVSGQIAARVFKMPALVGEIFAGILVGPPLGDIVPYAEAFVLIGELGLILLVIEAGIDIDLDTIKLIGGRGFLIAFIGSILPIGIGIALAIPFVDDMTAAIAAGASFGPTSLGIALNILRAGNILNTPVGQLIVSAAVIDDMIALVVLSQLEALTGDITAMGILIPVISALSFLIIGGYAAIFIVPPVISKYIHPRVDPSHHATVEMAIMFGLVLCLMPATYYAKASYLMGCFIAGLAFCTSHGVHTRFVTQFKRLLQWLMRIFFAASIGFQVPIKDFGQTKVIGLGFLFTLALLGKLAVGFLVPNFTQAKRFTGFHLRDCLATGFSMAAEGEFAFVIAVYAVDNGLIDKDLYASVVFAVLLSTIFPPFLLRYTINYYNKKSEELVRKAAEEELQLDDVETGDGRADALAEGIKKKLTVFVVIQTRSEAKWGLLNALMNQMNLLGLDVIDHRSWHPRGVNTTLVNEVYAKCIFKEDAKDAVDEKFQEIKDSLVETMDQPGAKVKVQRWYPGVVKEITEKINSRGSGPPQEVKLNLEERLLSEATVELEKHRDMQTMVTQRKSVKEIMAEIGEGSAVMEESAAQQNEGGKPKPRRRIRQKMRSTPVVGASLFGEGDDKSEYTESVDIAKDTGPLGMKTKVRPFDRRNGHSAEIVVNGEVFNIRVNDETLSGLRKGFSGDMLDSRGISVNGMTIQPDSSNVVGMLQGFVRNEGLARVEEDSVAESDISTEL